MPKKAMLLLLAITWTGDAVAQTITFGSDATWGVFQGDPSKRSQKSYGKAQAVCLNTTSPTSCPSGATLYGFAGAAWSADLAAVPGAEWIWAPCITGASSPADLQAYYFSNTFLIPGVPTGATLYLAADDWAEVIVNGVVVPLANGSLAYGSTTDPMAASAAQSQLAAFDILPYLREGSNVITVHASNGPKEFAMCAAACTYAENPAGVVFGGTITYQPPACQ